ncbi:hypothetical protein ASJ79_17380 [Mycobacterium sp. NAZ190054]|nr:hypothetical protein ASJ79_17380 [Mycobacterium sp. NAZ190054]
MTRTPTCTSPSRNRTGGRHTCRAVERPEWINDPAYVTATARQPHLFDVFADIENGLAVKTKYEAVDILRRFDVPCAPVLSMKEIAHDSALRASGPVVEVAQADRRSFLIVGSPIILSAFNPPDQRRPPLGEHSTEVLTELGFTAGQIDQLNDTQIIAEHA